MIKHIILRFLLATTFLLPLFASTGAASGVAAGTFAKDGSGNLTAVAQSTETPAAYPSPETEMGPAATATPGEQTPVPEGGYPAGANIDGTGRAGGGDRAILGNEPDNEEAAGAEEAAQLEQSGLGSFLLWLGFMFGLVVFIAGVFFSIFLSTRDRRADL